MNNLFFSLWFFLPAGIANVTPIFFSHMMVFRNLNYPLDSYVKLNNKRVFGDHKTIRGLISGIILGVISSVLLFYLAHSMPYAFRTLPTWYFSTNPILLGFLLSFGALFGDSVKSFFKRQINIPSGSTWIPFDQLDYILGALFFVSFIHILTLLQYCLILILWAFIHVISTVTGFLLHLKKQPL